VGKKSLWGDGVMGYPNRLPVGLALILAEGHR